MLGFGDKIALGLTTALLLAAVVIILRGPPDNRCCDWNAPEIVLQEYLDRDLNYSVLVTRTLPPFPLKLTAVYLLDPAGKEVEHHLIGLQPNTTGVWQGIDVTWDGQTANQSGLIPYYAYTDPVAAQVRIDQVLNGSDVEGAIHLSFVDDDRNGRISPGDRFYLDRLDPEGFAGFRGYTLKLRFYAPGGGAESKAGASFKLRIVPQLELEAAKFDTTNYTLTLTVADRQRWVVEDHLGLELLTPQRELVRSHVIGLREADTGEWVGIAVYYNESQLSYMADPAAANDRIDRIFNGSDAEGPIYFRYDNDGLKLLTSPKGDLTSFANHWVRVTWLPTGETLTELQLKG